MDWWGISFLPSIFQKILIYPLRCGRGVHFLKITTPFHISVDKLGSFQIYWEGNSSPISPKIDLIFFSPAWDSSTKKIGQFLSQIGVIFLPSIFEKTLIYPLRWERWLQLNLIATPFHIWEDKLGSFQIYWEGKWPVSDSKIGLFFSNKGRGAVGKLKKSLF